MGIEPTQDASAAPRKTVLKTARLASADVHHGPPRFSLCYRDSAVVRHRPQTSVGLAVILAVIWRHHAVESGRGQEEEQSRLTRARTQGDHSAMTSLSEPEQIAQPVIRAP
jgi:hypothetical protein